MNVSCMPTTRRIPPDQVQGQVDQMAVQFVVRSRAGDGPVQFPDPREQGVHDPVLQVHGAEMVDFAQPSGLDQLLGQRDRRHPAVVESQHVLDARAPDRGQRRLGFDRRSP
jgi:hypothetical protein